MRIDAVLECPPSGYCKAGAIVVEAVSRGSTRFWEMVKGVICAAVSLVRFTLLL